MSTQLSQIYVGDTEPATNSAAVRWISQSAKHFRISDSPSDRVPIIGTYINGSGYAQEPSPYFNTILNRWEMLVHIGFQQYWSYALTGSPLGAWSTPVAVLGTGVGGEAAYAIQASVYVENNIIYCVYCRAQGVSSYYVATSPMPTDPNVTPTFTANATAIATTSTIGGILLFNTHVIKNPNGGYLLLAEGVGTSPTLFSSAATSPTQWTSIPFLPVVVAITGDVAAGSLGYNLPPSYIGRYRSYIQRPQIFYENGTWVMIGSIQGLVINSMSLVRWTCNDTTAYPVNWKLDNSGILLYPRHWLEQDQQADVRLAQSGADGKRFAFWAGNNNNLGTGTTGFNILVAPVLEPVMAWDGAAWTPTTIQSSLGAIDNWVKQDQVTQAYYLQHLDDTSTDAATNSGVVLTCPTATNGVRFRSNNSAASGTNQVAFAVKDTDKISGGNPITVMSAVGTTVTVTTFADHGLVTGDLVTISGSTPTTYNRAGTACTVVSAKVFTYVASTAPAANTVLGVYERGLRPGETRAYICNSTGFYSRLTTSN